MKKLYKGQTQKERRMIYRWKSFTKHLGKSDLYYANLGIDSTSWSVDYKNKVRWYIFQVAVNNLLSSKFLNKRIN